mmetsp:Transcript_42094/g.64543  ORF Transcript_42094/g.64543 Transcript_42094/m.64543 type:complete len:323 (-) Transcript_42094:29-997(-)
MKKLQNFVKTYKSEEGKSLNNSIRKMAGKDESFNEFFKNFKAKNEQGWANIIDLTQEEQEDRLLEVTPEMRRNQMVMMEEFRRRKQMKDYWSLMGKQNKEAATEQRMFADNTMDFEEFKKGSNKWEEYEGTGIERFLEPQYGEIFDPSDFTLIFMASDSVTNVTSLNRTNARRVLIFLGNGNGLITYGKGKAEEYESAFEDSFKDARRNMICIDVNQVHTSPRMLVGRHNDFKIRIYPQDLPNYWGNPTIWKMLKFTGFFHCRFTCVSRKRDPYSLIYGFFKAVSQNKTMDQLATIQGAKSHKQGAMQPMSNSQDWRAALQY